MPLDTEKHIEELSTLAEAFGCVASLDIPTQMARFFLRQMDTVNSLRSALLGLEDSSLFTLSKTLETADKLSGVCGSISDHLLACGNAQFWKDQQALLLGLADHVQNTICATRKTARKLDLHLN